MAELNETYPWHAAAYRRLEFDRMPHALMLSGAQHIGKRRFAEVLSRRLLCDEPEADKPCGRCRACRLFDAGSHPDYLVVEPEETGRMIGIDQVRDVTAFLAMTSHSGRHKIALLVPAEVMHPAAANALLKTLEEPPGAALLILVTHNPAQLPATIRSRCRILALDRYDRSDARRWLETFEHADSATPGRLVNMPLRALDAEGQGWLATVDAVTNEVVALAARQVDPLDAATRLNAHAAAEVLRAAMQLLASVIRAIAGGSAHTPDAVADSDRHALEIVSQKLDLSRAFQLYDVLMEQLRALSGPTNPRVQDILDGMMLAWAAAFDAGLEALHEY